MSKTFKILAGALLVLIAVLIYLESGEKEDVNWFPSYTKSDKIPLGTYVLYNLLAESRSSQDFVETFQPPFTILQDSTDISGTYLFINDYVSFDDNEAMQLLSWVARGNTLFVASREISTKLRDTLSLATEIYYDINNFERKPLVQLANPSLISKYPYYIDKDIPSTHFTAVDTLKTIALGEFDLSNDQDTISLEKPKVHFIKQAFGEGEIIIHLMPEVFTNYFMLYDNHYTYTQHILSYIPKSQTLIWDNYYKNGKSQNSSPLYVLFQNKYLKYAYYSMIIGVLLWVIFEGRRKQRAIPIIKPHPNQSIAFTKTIAGMYLDQRDHKGISQHQINHFLEYVRSTYGIPTQHTNDSFITKLALKSDNTVVETRKLINFIVYVRNNTTVTQEQVTALNTFIEDFKK